MDISSFVKTAASIPPHIAILLRGSTGIGKSAIVNQIGKKVNKPVIDVRGSTMSEGDVIGYPDLEGMKVNNVMTFCMPSWFARCCKEPVILFLDEMNRSLPQVQQAFFQIVLDRMLGNDKDGIPYEIHPETQVIAAINYGAEYDVNDIDPALLRRFWTCDIEPDLSTWMDWARDNNIDFMITEFLRTRSKHFAPSPATIEPGKVFPTPASWTRLDETFKFSNIDLTSKSQSNKSLVFNLASGFLGAEAAIEFSDFVEKYENIVTPEDVLNSFPRFKDKINNMTNDRINGLIEQLGEHAKTNNWNVTQAENASIFAKSISEEMLIHFWAEITKGKNIETIQKVHKFLGDYLVDVVNSNKDIAK
jgi:hypothetical protein